MIKVQDLTKIYKSRDNESFMALDHISFTLPDAGMVFVLGKSGSGKSTLLNLLGGLDEFEEGEVFFEDQQLSYFTPKDFNDYRCRHIGFVFQDFHLLDELTVQENVALVLDLENAEHGDLVQNALAKVGMAQYASRYPRELSGGQKQRVAMARAIVKNPEVILCDEPTGNLDADNSRQILELLKEFSQTKLVIIVSHNLNDAENYSDRVLELLDGKIARDEERSPGYVNRFAVCEGTLTLPYNKTLSKEQIKRMVDGIRSGEIEQVVQNDDGFHAAKEQAFYGRPYTRRNSGMSFKDTMRLTRIMMKNQYWRFFLTALTATLIVSCFAVFQSFLNYSVNGTLSQAMIDNGFPAIAYQKGEISGSESAVIANNLIHINEQDLAAFRNTKYDDQMHILYAHGMQLFEDSSYIITHQKGRNALTNVSRFYPQETYGVLACDPAYLAHVFGNGQAPEVLAGDIRQPNKGVIITDYVADGIIAGNPDRYPDYEAIIGNYKNPRGFANGRIDAIIETHYEQRYGDLKDRLTQLRKNGDNEGLSELLASEEFLCFAEEVQISLGVSYTYSENYVADMATSIDFGSISFVGKMGFIINGVEGPASHSPQITDSSYLSGEKLASGEIVLGKTLYNSIMADSGSDASGEDFVPFEITVIFRSNNGEALGSRAYLVKNVSSNAANSIYMSTEDVLDIRQFTVTPYALYFGDVNAAHTINEIADERSFVVSNVEDDTATRLNRLIVTFSDLFRMFEFFLLAICVIYLGVFGANVIQKHKYQIGIIKSLGGKTTQIAIIFLSQLLVVGAMIFLLSAFGIWAATAVADDILMTSMKTHMSIEIFHFTIIDFYPHLAVIDLALVVLLIIVSSLAPLWALHNIKPINIIKAKE